jgi:hypothetical protein
VKEIIAGCVSPSRRRTSRATVTLSRWIVWISSSALLLVLGVGIAAAAHHGYADYDRESVVSVEGEIARVEWANPHVVLTLQTETGDYRVEWMAFSRLSREGVRPGELKAGDRIVATGSVNRDPDKRILTLLRTLDRPADGWHWSQN